MITLMNWKKNENSNVRKKRKLIFAVSQLSCNVINNIIVIVCSEEIRNEIKALKKEYKNDKKSREAKDEPVDKKEKEKETDNEMVQNYLSEQRKYSHLKKDLPKKGAQRYCLIRSLLYNWNLN